MFTKSFKISNINKSQTILSFLYIFKTLSDHYSGVISILISPGTLLAINKFSDKTQCSLRYKYL